MSTHLLQTLLNRLNGELTAWFLRVLGMRRRTKRVVLILVDFSLLFTSLWLAYALRHREIYVPPSWEVLGAMLSAPVITIVTFAHLDLYRRVTRYIGGSSFNTIGVGTSLSVFVWATMVWLTQADSVPRLAAVLYIVFGACSVWGTRQIIGWVLRSVAVEVAQLADSGAERRTNILIYGAGSAGKRLADALVRSSRYDPIGFVDPDPTLGGQFVGSIKVYRPNRLPSLVTYYDVREIILALPSSRADRQEILRTLEPLNVTVRTLPTLEELAHGRLTVRDLRPIGVIDLLGRDHMAPIPELVEAAISGRSIMVTGAGGSIGSEIVRQCLASQPARLIMFDTSENALYTIEREVERWLVSTSTMGPRPQIVTVLGSVVDSAAVERAIRENAVQTIYHAAAVKHVSLTEANPGTALLNNTFGTITVAKAALRLGVERFVCISTDKAVRPTNVMGASKRLAEMMLQALAAEPTSTTVITIVRLGHVLDSPDSEVRLFRRQIETGGPVMVTDRDMVRHFRSIPDVALLVLQAGQMAKGGEVFVLDRGEPFKIDELARSIIRQSGMTVRDAANPMGDIEISYIGQRPSERRYEEVFHEYTLQDTLHPSIKILVEPPPERSVLEKELATLSDAIEDGDVAGMTGVLCRIVEGFRGGEASVADALQTIH